MSKKIVLKPKKDEAVKRFHPWVFTGAIKGITEEVADGDWVEVYSSNGTFLAAGHYQAEGSIAVRLLTWEQEEPDETFWVKRLKRAFGVREAAGLTSNESLNAYRLVFAEGDQLEGLIIDNYNGHMIIQCHAAGMLRSVPQITAALSVVMGDALKSVYLKSPSSHANSTDTDPHLVGKVTDTIINEYGMQCKVDWEKGQKTGFFLDQRENRLLIRNLAKGKKVLNTFCYTGGFSVAALNGGASLVHSVDSSASAIELLKENFVLNGYDTDMHPAFIQDTLQFLKETTTEYDIVILDPPAYAKHLSARHNAVQGYIRLNAAAMAIMPPGSLLMTFSCSQVVDRKLFESSVMAAALTAKRTVSVLSRLSQPADHPVSIFHPEGEYLKGLLLVVQ